jgi:hypothetical protein
LGYTRTHVRVLASLWITQLETQQFPQYIYKAVPPPAPMRLLRLRPAGLRDDIPLECEIVYVDSFATHSYETVSWCSGREKQDQVLRIREGGQVYTLYISHNLKSALVALRRDDAVRQLWVDEVCIDWTSAIEHNYYVYRMSPIFGAADRLCIWLGASDVDSRLAIDFIKNKVMMNIKEFDTLIEDRSLFREWVAFIGLMKRPWFTRRWSVTELGLSPLTATLYCGKDSIEWMHFTDVVSLFVGAESATHRLSDVSKLDQPFDHIPDFIGDISSLGVAVLTDATANLFRNSANGVQEPLCSLEYLVSRFSMFDVIEPRDAIYSLVMISRDTTPSTLNEPYNVDYRLPVIDVYREFIEFSIYKSDKVNALDILCRPWAPPVFRSHDGPSLSTLAYGAGGEVHSEIPLPSWISCLVGGPFEMEEHPTAGLRMARQNVDPLVGLPGNHAGNYTAAGTKVLNLGKLEFIKWGVFEEGDAWSSNYSMFVEGFVLDEVSTVEQIASNGNIPLRWLGAGGWTDTNGHPPEELWRTLVADRGRSGLINPPNWFARALKVSVESQAKTTRGSLDTMKLIYEGRLASVTEFLRRVQEVVWNRRLIRTASGRLGLVREDVRPGYKVCILYGCTVPVILEEVVKSQKQMRSEHLYYYRQWLKERERIVALCQARFRMRRLRRDRAQEKESVNERPPEPTKISYSKCGQCRKDSQSVSSQRNYLAIDLLSWVL